MLLVLVRYQNLPEKLDHHRNYISKGLMVFVLSWRFHNLKQNIFSFFFIWLAAASRHISVIQNPFYFSTLIVAAERMFGNIPFQEALCISSFGFFLKYSGELVNLICHGEEGIPDQSDFQ